MTREKLSGAEIVKRGQEKIMGFLPPGKSKIKGYYPSQ